MSRNLSVTDRLSGANIKLLDTQPFFGVLSCALPYHQNDNLPTMATDGKSIMYNERFVQSLTDDELVGVNAHEILHVALLHPYRRGNRHHFVANVAMDLVVNWLLKQSGFVLPKDVLYSEQFANMSFEEVYDKLMEELKNRGIDPFNMRNQCPTCGKSSSQQNRGQGNGQGQSQKQNNQQQGQSSGQGQQSSQGQNNQQQGQNNGQQNNTCPTCGGSGNGSNSNEDGIMDALAKAFKFDGKKFIGDHSPWEKSMSPSELQREAERMADMVRQARDISRMKYQGKGSSLIDRAIDQLFEPQIDWRKYVMRFLEPVVRDQCYTHPDRRFLHDDLILPGDASEDGRLEGVVFVFDTSGSVSPEELKRYLSDTQGLMRQFPETQAWYMSCDYDVTEPQDLETVDGSTIDVKRIRLRGGGGTSFVPPFEYFKKHRYKYNVKLLVYFTDGYGDFPTEKPPYPVIFCVTSPERLKDVPEWATTVPLKV